MVVRKYPDRFVNIPVIRYAETYTAATMENILLERRKEFAMEGLYFWDLMQTGRGIVRDELRASLSSQEITIPYGDFRLAFPIPDNEITANPNIQQNQGYGGV